MSAARQFLKYLRCEGLRLDRVRPPHVAKFLAEKLGQCQERLGRLPKNIRQWPRRKTAAIYKLLRMVYSQWPPLETPANQRERFQRELCEGYGHWLTEVKGLSSETLRKNGDAARLFLKWLGPRTTSRALRNLDISDIDGYLAWRMSRLRRATRHGVAIAYGASCGTYTRRTCCRAISHRLFRVLPSTRSRKFREPSAPIRLRPCLG
jgi:hypothetical protein